MRNNELACCLVPIFGMIAGVIQFAPMFVCLFVPGVLMTLLFWPIHAFNIAFTTAKSNMLGPTLRVCLMVVLPLPILLYPAFLIAVGAVFSVCVALFGACFGMGKAMLEDDKTICEAIIYGPVNTAKLVKDILNDYWIKNLDRSTYIELQTVECSDPYDVSLLAIPILFVASLFGLVFAGVSITLLAVLKFIPGLFFRFIWIWKVYFEEIKDDPGTVLCCFPWVVLASAMLPFGAVLALVASILGGFIAGAVYGPYHSFYEGATRPSLRLAVEETYCLILEFDIASQKLCFANDDDDDDVGPLSKLCCPPEDCMGGASAAQTKRETIGKSLHHMVYKSLFNQIYNVAVEFLESGKLSDIRDTDELRMGLVSVVVFDAAYRSREAKGGVVLANGKKISKAKATAGHVSGVKGSEAYPDFVSVADKLKEANYSDSRRQFIRERLLQDALEGKDVPAESEGLRKAFRQLFSGAPEATASGSAKQDGKLTPQDKDIMSSVYGIARRSFQQRRFDKDFNYVFLRISRHQSKITTVLKGEVSQEAALSSSFSYYSSD